MPHTGSGKRAPARRADAGDAREQRRRLVEARARAQAQDGKRERHPEPEVPSERDPAWTRPSRLPVAARRRPARPKRSAAGGAPVDKGARVRVLDGPFRGKVGVVQELDGKGGARVLLGLLAVQMSVEDLGAHADGGGRPLLSTSHRRPTPARSTQRRPPPRHRPPGAR